MHLQLGSELDCIVSLNPCKFQSTRHIAMPLNLTVPNFQLSIANFSLQNLAVLFQFNSDIMSLEILILQQKTATLILHIMFAKFFESLVYPGETK